MFGPTGLAVTPAVHTFVNNDKTTKKQAAVQHEHDAEPRSRPTVDGNINPICHLPSVIPALPPILHEGDHLDDVDEGIIEPSLNNLPLSNPSFEMAYFLKTTGPTVSHQPKEAKTKKVVSLPSSAFHLFKGRDKQASADVAKAHERSINLVGSEKSSADSFSGGVRQKLSKDGKKYLQITPQLDLQTRSSSPPRLSSKILESRVSVLVSESFDECVQLPEGAETERGRKRSTRNTSGQSVRILTDLFDQPVRPAASDPPTPTQDSAVEITRNETLDLIKRFPNVDTKMPLTSNPRSPSVTVSLSRNDLMTLPPIQTQDQEEQCALLQPFPLRLRSRAGLLQRSSSDASALGWSQRHQMHIEQERASSASPGPPPPRSPLRLKRNPHLVDDLLDKAVEKPETAREQARDETLLEGRRGPSEAKEVGSHQVAEYESSTASDTGCSSQNPCDRVQVQKQRHSWIAKGRSRAKPWRVDDTVTTTTRESSPPPARRRLQRTKFREKESKRVNLSKMRRHITMAKTKDKPSPIVAQSGSFHKPVMKLVAPGVALPIECVPEPIFAAARQAISVPVKERKSPEPRQHSAKMTSKAKRSAQTPSRPSTPVQKGNGSINIDFPSPPPQRELPPTPRKAADVPALPPQPEKSECHTTPPTPKLWKPAGKMSSSLTFAKPSMDTGLSTPPSSTKATYSRQTTVIPAEPSPQKASVGESIKRLEAQVDTLCRQNKLLEAALMAMLKTNGTLNGCPYHANGLETNDLMASGATAALSGHPAFAPERQDCMAERQSIGSGVSGGSSGQSALDVYMSTRGHRSF